MKNTLFFISLIWLVFNSCNSPNQTSPQEQEEKSLKIIYTDWSEGVAISYLVKNLLEQELGYSVTMKLADLQEIYPTLAKGDYDVFLDAWLPVTHKAEFQQNKENIVQAGTVYQGAVAGLVAPEYFPIDSLAQLKQINPPIVGIDSTSGVVRNTILAAKKYGFKPNIKTGSEKEMMNYLDDAYKRRKLFVITGWKPHAMFSKYQLKFLTDDLGIYGKEESIFSVANKKKLASDKVLKEFLERFSLTNRQISKLIQVVHAHPDGVNAGAKDWIQKHQIIVSRWTKNLSEFQEKAL